MRRPGVQYVQYVHRRARIGCLAFRFWIYRDDRQPLSRHGRLSWLFSFILDVERKGQRAATSKRIERSSRVKLHWNSFSSASVTFMKLTRGCISPSRFLSSHWVFGDNRMPVSSLARSCCTRAMLCTKNRAGECMNASQLRSRRDSKINVEGRTFTLIDWTDTSSHLVH